MIWGMRMRALVVVLAVSALVAGCGSSDGGSSATTSPKAGKRGSLDGRTFTATSATEGGTPHPLVAGSVIEVAFDDGRVRASAGCNQMSGPYRLVGDALTLGSPAMTEIGCDTTLMDQDTWLVGVLARPLTVSEDAAGITLTAGATVLVLAEEAEVAAAALEQTVWTLDSLVDGDAVSTPPQGAEVTLVLQEGGISFRTPCDRGSAGAAIDEDAATVTISAAKLAGTGPDCTPEVRALHDRAVALLADGVVAYRIDDRLLTLTRDGSGLVFRAPGA
jgi:heat shock protein HslJ